MLAASQHTHFVVTTKSVEKAIYQLKQKSSGGNDYVSAMHLKHGGFLLVKHITLLMQIIFTQCKVPTAFCIGDLTPIPKKWEDRTSMFLFSTS